METMAMSPHPGTPRTSHIRSSSNSRFQNPAAPAQDATATALQRLDGQQHPLSVPASQESLLSARSAGSSNNALRLQSSSSSVSQLTDYTTLTSPVSTSAVQSYDRHYTAERPDLTRRRTPENALQSANGTEEYALTSPMSLASPTFTNGAKRTASGHVKNAPSLPSTPLTATLSGHRSRTESMSSTGSRAGELAANLKARLGYASYKVQHGWEHKDINEVERLAAYKAHSHNHSHRHSMSHLDQIRRPGSNGTAQRGQVYDAYANDALNGTRSPPSKRHSGVYTSLSQPTMGTTPRLQPAADIRATANGGSGPREYHYPATAPSSQTTYQQYHPHSSNGTSTSNAMSPPRTPNFHARGHRPPTIRTDTETADAEREALQTLMQLGSPQTHTPRASSQYHSQSQVSSLQGSPLRVEFGSAGVAGTPRRVTFARGESDESSGSGRGSGDGSGSGL